jgi:hypothetical protein
VQAVLERLGKAGVYRHKVRDVLRRRGVVVGVQVTVEEGLGRGERALLFYSVRVCCNDGYVEPTEDEGAVCDLYNIEEVKAYKYSVKRGDIY